MKLSRKKGIRQATLGLIFTGFILGGFVVQAQLFRDAYVVSTVHLFPASIDAEGWENVETLTFQNLEQYALLQEFNAINSATLREPGSRSQFVDEDEDSLDLFVPVATATATETQDSTPTTTTEISLDAVTSDSSGESGTEGGEQIQPTTTVTEEPVIEFEFVESETDVNTSTESVVPSIEDVESGTTTVLKRMNSFLRLAFSGFATIVEATTTATSSAIEAVIDTDTAVPEPEATEDENDEVVVEEPVVTEVEEAAEMVDEEVAATATTTTSDIEISEPIENDDNTDFISESTTATTSATTNSSTSTEEIVDAPTVSVAGPEDGFILTDNLLQEGSVEEGFIGCTDNCDSHVITLDNFAHPLDQGVEISGAQLRMSVAAAKKVTRERTPALTIQYSVDGKNSWTNAGSIVVESEESNSINGGYYLFALPQVTNQETLNNLSVQIRYDDDMTIVKDLYIDSAWVELFTLEQPEDDELTNNIAEMLANDGFDPEMLSGDMLTLPDGDVIDFTFTDDNEDETLIIKSNDVTYNGLSQVTTYFSVTNTSDRPDDFTLNTYFPNDRGEVLQLDVYNQNKPRQVIIPEYRPYVYHCDAGWEVASEAPADITSLSQSFATSSEEAVSEDQDAFINDLISDANTLNLGGVPTSSTSTTDDAIDGDLIASVDSLLGGVQVDETPADSEELEDVQYSCRETSVVQTCDYLEGDNTSCVREQVLVEEHKMTQYAPGWDALNVIEEDPDEPGFFTRVATFLGFGPDKKEVPDSFEMRARTPDEYTIEPGETKYFRMEIGFGVFSTGEYWVEAVGDREYGLLDPFWQSTWGRRLPITIDNTGNASSTEQQVFLTLDNATSSFWANVREDGGDIRFVREEPGNANTWFDQAYEFRKPIPITVGSERPDGGYDGYSVQVELDTATLIGDNDMLSSCDDLRVVYGSGTGASELDRVVNDCNASTTQIAFALADDHATGTVNNNYFIYYGNSGAGTPPSDSEQVFLWYDDVSSDRLSDYTADQGTNWHGAGTSNTFAYNASGYYTFDTGDNFNESIRIPNATLSERDVYVEAEFFIDNCHPSNTTKGLFARYINTTSYYASNHGNTSGLGSCAAPYAQTGDVVKDSRTGTVVDGTDPGALTNGQWRTVALAAWGINDTNLTYWDVNDSANFGPTGWPSVAPLADGSDTGTDIESAGEVGIMVAQIGGRVRNILVRRYTEVEPIVGTTTPAETLTTGSFVELDHWLQHFSTTTETADVWVQVDELAANSSTTIHMYYDNPLAESTSDEYAPFTYDTPRDLYYVVNSVETGPLSVYSLIDDNTVTLGASTTVLQSGEVVVFDTYASSSVLSANGPITSRTTQANSEPLVPISFASTTHITPTDRGNEEFFILSPFADADVEVFAGGSLTAGASSTVLAGETDLYAVNIGGGDAGIIESTEPVLLYHNEPGDSYVAYPPTMRDLYGFRSDTYNYAAVADGAEVVVMCSDGTIGTTSAMLRGEQASDDFCTNGSQGTGNALRLSNITEPIGAVQEADSDGGESSRFLPTPEFGTRYIVPQGAEYISIACAPRFGSTTIEIRTSLGAVIDSGSCSPTGEFPGALNFTPGSPYPAGTQIVSPDGIPFYTYYEAAPSETNTWSAVQAKQFGALDLTSELGEEEINTDAQYTQNNFAWYENAATSTPSTRWSLGDAFAVEGESITGGGAVNAGDELRLRINLEANNGTGTVASAAFRLQYAEGAPEQCSSIVSDAWVSVPAAGSTTAAFTGFDNAGVSDGETLLSALLSDTTVLATYEEANISNTIPNQVNPDNFLEFDWVLQAEAPTVNANYCFRMVRSAGQELIAYDVYPEVEIAGPPGVPTLFTPFDNEHASSTDPQFEFSALDIAGDDLEYQVQVSTDVNFGSTVIDRQSDVNLFDFENLQSPADKAPFDNGQRIRFNPPTSLTNGATYWWRVRASDPNGSATFGSWSEAQSFTVDTSVTVTEWFQTTDEQFETGTLDSAQTSGSDSVELDIAGSNLIGEYGSLTVNVGATTTVNLDNTYTDPVVVVSHRYSRGVADGDQPIIRVFNKSAGSFDFLAYTFDFDAIGTTTVDYIVMESGEYIMADGSDGIRVFATSTSVSTVVGRSVPANPGGPIVVFPTSFSAAPTVLSAVTTNNDPQWVVATIYDGVNRNNPPTATQVGLYLNDSLAADGHSSAEDIDIVAFDPITGGINDGVIFESLRTPNSVTDTPFTQSFASAFSSTPGTILINQQTMNGGDGGYSMVDIDTPPTSGTVTVAAEEGGTADGRGHTNETIGIVAFESGGGDIIRGGNAQITSSAIDFDDVKLGNSWGEVAWSGSGDISVRVQYQTGSGFQDIPDSELPGNSSSFTSSPINILDLDTTIYNELRLVAVLSGVDPELEDWTVAWGQRVEIPTLGDPFDNEKVGTTTPTFDFVTTDPQGDDLEYEISISVDPAFELSSSTRNSGIAGGFSGSTASPFTSGETITYTPITPLVDGTTYWWRARAKDPAGGDAFSPWSNPDSFTVDTSVVASTWHQTTEEQFRDGIEDGTFASTSDSVEVSPVVGEYGTTTLANNQWQTITTEQNYENMIVIASPEFAFDGGGNGRTARVRNKTSNSFEVKVDDYTNAFAGSTEVDYVVMEAGEWTIADGDTGTRIIAGTAEDVSNVKGNVSYNNSVGTIVGFSPSFGTAPGAVLTVSSNNDPSWVGTHIDDGVDRTNSITTSQMSISLARSHEASIHAPEDVDYIVFETATGSNSGVLFDAFNTAPNIGDGGIAANYNQTGFSAAPAVTVAHQNANRAGQGSFSHKDLNNPSTASTLFLSATEIGATADGHANAEMVSILAFENSEGLIERDASSAGGLSGTIRSETIDFFDGNGPRFEEFYWSDSTPGTSEARIQLEYFDGTSWNLVPDDDWYNANWSRRVPITIQATQVEDDVTDFPVYVDLADLGGVFWDNVLGTGADVRVTESDGSTEVPFDLTYIDAGSDQGELHFLGNLSSTTNQTYYVYFGNPSASGYAASDPFGAENVWVNNYDARHQLGEDPTLTAPQFTDSTGNGYNATARSGMTTGDVVGGQIGRAIDLDGDDGGLFDIDFAYPGAFTASMWWNSSGDGFAISTDAGSNEKFGPWSGGNMFTRVVSDSDSSLPSPTDGTWSYIALQRDASDKVDLYINGVQTRLFGDVAQPGTSDWENFGGQTSQGFVGLLDELRFATGTRSVGWLDTEYNNQLNPNAFYQVGSAQQSSGDTLVGNNSGFTGGGPVDISGLDVNVYNTVRLVATLECSGGDCPTLDDWSVEWGEGVQMTGTLQEADLATNVASGTIRVAVNGTLQGGTGSVSNGNWVVNNVTAFAGDVITVYVEGAADADRAVTSFVYNGAGNMTGVALYEQHLTLAGDNSEPLTNALLASYDNSVAGDTDIFFNVTGANELEVCAVSGCDGFSLFITEGIDYRPSDTSAGDINTGGFRNEGTFTLDGNTMRVGGNWNNQATSTLGTGEVIFTATTGTYSLIDHTDTLTFPTVTFGEGSGSAVWDIFHPMTVTGDWSVDFGTVDRLQSPEITVNGNVAFGSSGILLGGGTTTFAGTGASSWSDASAGQNLGNVVIDGNSKTVSLTSDVYANDLTIGADDTLQGGSGNTIHVGGDFTNNGTFTPNTSTVELVDDDRGRQFPGLQPSPWYDTAWSSRYPITIQAAEIDDDLSDFPVTVDLSDLPSAFWGEVSSSGGDIRVTTADATTELAREISEFSAVGETGELHFLAPSLSSTTDTTFYLYFGNATATDYAVTDPFGAEAVWVDYAGVWHFAEGSGTTANDSTSNGNDGTLQGSPTWTAGQLGTALEFDGNGDSGNRVQLPGVLDGTATTTVSVWFTQNAVESGGGGWTYVLHSSGDANVGSSEFWLGRLGSPDPSADDIGAAYGGWANGLGHTNTFLERDNRYYHVTAVQADGEVRLYVNGQLEQTRAQSMFTFTGEDWGIGAAVSGTPGFRSHPGVIDSPRISTVDRSDAWIAAEFTNGATTTDFYSVGAVEGELGITVTPATPHEVTTGGANLYRFTMNDATSSASFVESSVVVQNNFTIATGSIALPTTQLSVGGDFANTGGVFMHNNSEVRFTGGGTKNIEQRGTAFLNAFYDVVFAGSGNWTYLDANATTTNTYTISNGNVTFPSGSLTVGRDFVASGSGGFDANEGEVIFLIEGPDEIASNGSEFHDVRIREIATSTDGWFDNDWQRRLPIMVQATATPENLTDFPVYVDLADMPASFFTEVQTNGADIRVTEADGETEVPLELVDISVASSTGELYFLATNLSSSTDTTYYMYYNNSAATAPADIDPNGRNAVWRNGYVAVYHLPTTIDSTGNGHTLTESNITAVSDTLVGDAADFNGSNSVYTYGDPEAILDGHSEFTLSMWLESDTIDTDNGFFIADAITGGDDGICARYDTAGATAGGDDVIKGCLETSSNENYETAEFDQTTDAQYFTKTWTAGSALEVYLNAVATTFTDAPASQGGTTNVGGGTMYIGAGSKDSAAGGWDGRIDAVRIASSSRSIGWIEAEYTNQSTSTDFYSIGQPQESSARTFTTANVTATGNVVIENGRAVFPSGTFSIEESFDNDGEFDANNGRVTFTNATGTHTVAPGISSFAELFVNSTGGSLTIIENATATDGIALQAANDFVVDSGITLETTGTFSNVMASTSTTWTGSTLRLSGGQDFSVNDKLNSGDTYDTVEVNGDGDIAWWNSDAITYTLLDTASIYSQDHATVDGDLYIFGDYTRATGTEYWNYATDFDGADLTGGSERLVNVRGASSTVVTINGATLDMRGVPSATTTVDAQSGAFTVIASSSTLVAEHFAVTNLASTGFELLGSTTISTLADGLFTVTPGRTGMTIDASTIDTNPASQFFRVDFATTTAGAANNVSLNGSPSSFVWFRDGVENLYGEAFDSADGNPGSVQWDDSNFQVDISGTVYSDTGVTPIGAPTCDGSTTNVRIQVDGTDYTDSVACDAATGDYSFSNVSYNGDANIIVYLDTNGGAQGSVVSRTPTGDITDMDIFLDQVIVRHENLATLSIADMIEFDNDDDSDIAFVATTTGTDQLDILPGSGLFVWHSKSFVPDGVVNLSGAGVTETDGSLTIGGAASYISTSTNDVTVGGSFFVGTGGVFDGASSTVTFTATNTGQEIGAGASSTITFADIVFNGSGGEWAVQTPIISRTNIAHAAGTITGVSDITVESGSFSGNGLVDMASGTVTIESDNTLGGTNSWTFHNLTLGDGTTLGITTPASSATTTVRSELTIASGHFLDAGSSTWDLSGNGLVLIEDGDFQEDTSTVRYSGATPDITQTPYYDLVIDTGSGGSVIATGPLTGLQVTNDLQIGLTGTSTLDLNTNDPTLGVTGNVLIGSLGTLDASDTSATQVSGDWDNNGVFVANGGEVRFINASGTATIAAGASAFADVSITGAGSFTVTENATSTGDFLLQAGAFTLQSGETLAVGGSFTNDMNGLNTTWTGTTLNLFSGTPFTINAKTQSDTYENIVIEDETHVRVWNTTVASVTTNAMSSLYAMDHEDVDGELFIYGDLVSDSNDDHWSYATDFDGTSLIGSERTAIVTVENGGSVNYIDGSLSVVGTSTASTSIAAAGSGSFAMEISGSATALLNYYTLRDTDIDGLVFAGTPDVTDISFGDYLVEVDGGSAITVGGTAINANPAKNFTDMVIATSSAINAFNVTATGTSVSSWRFVNVAGNLEGEAFDVDPAGDPGYVVWEDSAAIINISGTVYSDDGVTTMGASVCDGTTNNIRLSIQGLTFASTTCNGSGFYEFTGVGFGPSDTLAVYINDEVENAVTVTQDPVSSIGNMDLYQDRVIVRHEGASAMTIADMGVWDSDDDADMLFDVETTGTDTLVLPANTELVIWDSKEFAPNGDVTVSGGGAGAAYDGSLVLQDNAQFTASSTESHSVGGSFEADTGAVFTPAQSTFTFTTDGVGRTVDTNDAGFYSIVFDGTGSWNITGSAPTIEEDITITSGDVTLPISATTTIGGSFENTGGSFDANDGALVFSATDSGNIIQLGGSDAAAVQFTGTGGAWSITDVNATTTDAFVVASGTVTLPSGILTVGGDFTVLDTIAHNNGTLELMGAGGGNTVTLSGNDLNNLVVEASTGDYTLAQADTTLLGDLTLVNGSLTAGTSTLTVGGSFNVAGGTFVNSTGTVLFNSASTGETVTLGTNELFNATFSNPAGGWVIVDSATTTNNFTIQNADSFTLTSGETLYVGGVFTNEVGGAATTWAGSTLVLDSGTEYEINSKSVAAEQYDTLQIGPDTDVASWNSQATTTIVDSSASWYSQDHRNLDGQLAIYGDYTISTSTEYWSYATDFDGTALTTGSREVTVSLVDQASVSVLDSGVLRIIGDDNGTTTIQNSGTAPYSFTVAGGTINWDTYAFRDLPFNGIVATGTPAITALSRGDFEIDQDGGTALRLERSVLDANPSLIVTESQFNTVAPASSGVNVRLSATSTNAWRFTSGEGNLYGEGFDVDGVTSCGSIRWDDSDCLLTEQTEYRWRNDDGGLGVPTSEWFDTGFEYRKQIRIANNTGTAYTDLPVQVTVTYDGDMRSDFADLRFTDLDGVTLTDHWVERQVASTEAEIWVTVPSLPANETATLQMYFGSSTASSVSSSTAVFDVFDDFEDNNLTEYSGDTAKFQTNTTRRYGGSYGLQAVTPSDFTDDGITRLDQTISQGQTIRTRLYVDAGVGDFDEQCTLFGVQSSPANSNYAVCIVQFGTERISLAKDARRTDNYIGVTQLSSQPYDFTTTGWYEIEVDWETDDSMFARVYDPSGTLVATTSATDSSYTSGGYGFMYWTNNGAWDGFHSRPLSPVKPTVFSGAKQTFGGASYAAAQSVPATGFIVGDTARLRVAIENTGLDITGQEYQIEYAPKGVAPSCAAVASGDYSPVPISSSCGTDAICMTDSLSVANGEVTSDLLRIARNEFVAGEYVEAGANQTTVQDLDQGRYTELEYAVSITTEATDQNYCFRITNDGVAYDSYTQIPELSLSFDPVMDPVSLNDGQDIALSVGTTTTITASTTVTDFNGFGDLTAATTTFYTTAATALCAPDDNDCYIATSTCTFTDCAGSSCTLSCTADFAYHTNPTDGEVDEWFAFMEVEDAAGGSDFNTSTGVDVLTLFALDVQNTINYGALDVNQDTGSFNPEVDVLNLGNDSVDVRIAGTDMSDGITSIIPASQQIFSTSTFSYDSCVTCNVLSPVGTDVEVDLPKPVVSSPAVQDDVYWGIEVPFGTASNPHTGENTFSVIPD